MSFNEFVELNFGNIEEVRSFYLRLGIDINDELNDALVAEYNFFKKQFDLE